MLMKQISIFIENRKGRLAEITDIIAQNNINIRALSIADTTNFGILRLIVDDPVMLEKILKSKGITASITSVISVGIKDEPGGLAKVLKVLADNDITIEYMYAFISKNENEAYVIMRIEKETEAVKLLQTNGYDGIKE